MEAKLAAIEALLAAGHKYYDEAAIVYATTEVVYVIGTNANAANPGSWLAGTKTTRLLLVSTTNCLVRFNGIANVQMFLFANFEREIILEVTSIHVIQQAADGTLYVHVEG